MEKHTKTIRRAENILSEKPHKNNLLLSKIISSQLDVDRFDYLLRDSHFCGVSYGIFDLHWLMSCLKAEDDKIFIVSKGVRALEHYLMARRLMNHNVYFHKKKCAAEYLLKSLFNLLKKKLDNIDNETTLIKFIQLINRKESEAEQNKWEPKEFEDAILSEGFADYSDLMDDDVWMLIKKLSTNENKVLQEIANRFINRNLPEVIHVKENCSDYVESAIETICENLPDDKKWRFKLCKEPISVYGTKKAAKEIFVQDKIKSKHYSNILEYSAILSSFADKAEKFEYLYYSKTDEVYDQDQITIEKKISELYGEGCFYGMPNCCKKDA